MLLMLLQVENQRYQPLSVATTRFYEQQKTKNLPTVVTFPPLLVLCDAKSNVVQESSMNHFKISLEDTFQQSTPSFFLSPKSETELVASLKSTSVARRDNQKIVLAAVQQDTAFKNVCQNLVASHPASYWFYNPCVIQYRSYCWKTRTPREVIAIPFLLRSAFCCF